MADPLATPIHRDLAGIAATSNPVSNAAERISLALHAFPPLLTTVILIAGAIAAAAIVHRIALNAIRRWIGVRHPAFGAFLDRTRLILFLGLAIILLSSVVPAAPLAGAMRLAALHGLSAGFILLLGWAAILAIDVLSEHQIARHRENIQADVMARRHATQWQVLRRLSHVVIVLIALAAALMVFPAVREYGVSLLASAGAAGIVLGFAARPVLSNLIAGIQLAITQPFRIEDAVVINDQWGWIEEITATYVVVRIWNWQRMIVPLAWLLEQPFQNWTRESAELIGTVHWNVDYIVPVEVLRKKLDEIVHGTQLWNGKVAVLQVVEALPSTIQLRALVSARNSGEAWDLRCYVREKMIAFLQKEYPRALPRQRVEMAGEAPSGPTARNESVFAEAD
jgi:small-conductance mechanosensitive channel